MELYYIGIADRITNRFRAARCEVVGTMRCKSTAYSPPEMVDLGSSVHKTVKDAKAVDFIRKLQKAAARAKVCLQAAHNRIHRTFHGACCAARLIMVLVHNALPS